MNKDKKKVYLKSFGCQMNVRDSEVICGLLRTMNYELTTNLADAEVVIFNTCSVRQHAEDKVWSEIGRMARIRGQSPSGRVPLIGLVGCMAQNYQEKIFERAPQVDFAVGPSDIAKIPGIIKSLAAKWGQSPTPRHIGMPGVRLSAAKGRDSPLLQVKIWETDGGSRPEEIYHTGFYADKEHVYVVISEGCSNYCSYCVVPYVRGQLRHRRCGDILDEIRKAVDNGITRVTLLGQNVNAYEDNGINFVRLVKSVNSVRGLKEFSFITSHPKDTGIELFKAMADCRRLKKYLHLPLQSGSDRVLKLMNRGYSRDYYLDLVDKYRRIVKDAVLTTDVIVGFPAESGEDFQRTYELVKEIEFEAAYIFKYSPRPQTKAADLPDDVPQPEKQRRHRLILELQKAISSRKTALKKQAIISALSILAFSGALYNYALAAQLEQVKFCFLKGYYKQAISEGEKLLAQEKNTAHSDELYYLLGLSYLKDGNCLRASDIFEIILSEYKNSPFKQEAMLGLGDSYFLRGDYPKAKDCYLGLLKTNPNTKLKPQLYLRLSKIGFKQGDIRQGNEYLVRLRQEFPQSLELALDEDLSSLPQEDNEVYYTVQVGAFSGQPRAQRLRQELEAQGYTAFIEETCLEGRRLYRVRVGKFRLRQDALSLKEELQQKGYPARVFP